MKGIKKADYIIQGILIAAGFIMAVTAKDILDTQFLAAYFTVGGWQVLSVIVHFFYKAPYPIMMRKIYLVMLGIVILIVALSLLTDTIIVVLMGLLFLSPTMAVYYLITCIKETKALSPPAGDTGEQL